MSLLKPSRNCHKCKSRFAVNLSNCCEICTLKRTSTDNFGTVDYWQDLAKMLLSQEQKCPYSGISLKLGTNTSLDHKIPKSKGGANDLANVQWVHVWINLMKAAKSEQLFLEELDEFILEIIKFRNIADQIYPSLAV